MRRRTMRIIEVVTDTGHVAAKFSFARKIEIRSEGGLLISGRTYSSADLLSHLDTLIEGVDTILAAKRSTSDPCTLRGCADRNRREIARRLNALQTEISDNGYSTPQAAGVLISLRCRLDDWFEPYDRLATRSRAGEQSSHSSPQRYSA